MQSFVGFGNRSAQIKPDTIVAISTDINGENAQLINYTKGQSNIDIIQYVNDKN